MSGASGLWNSGLKWWLSKREGRWQRGTKRDFRDCSPMLAGLCWHYFIFVVILTLQTETRFLGTWTRRTQPRTHRVTAWSWPRSHLGGCDTADSAWAFLKIPSSQTESRFGRRIAAGWSELAQKLSLTYRIEQDVWILNWLKRLLVLQ